MSDKVALMILVAKKYADITEKNSFIEFVCNEKDHEYTPFANLLLTNEVFKGYNIEKNRGLIYDIALGPTDNVNLMKAYVNFFDIRPIEIAGALLNSCKQGNIKISNYLNERYESLKSNKRAVDIFETGLDIWLELHYTCNSGNLNSVKWFYENIIAKNKKQGARYNGSYNPDIQTYINDMN